MTISGDHLPELASLTIAEEGICLAEYGQGNSSNVEFLEGQKTNCFDMKDFLITNAPPFVEIQTIDQVKQKCASPIQIPIKITQM